jgi:hypothetical protein
MKYDVGGRGTEGNALRSSLAEHDLLELSKRSPQRPVPLGEDCIFALFFAAHS